MSDFFVLIFFAPFIPVIAVVVLFVFLSKIYEILKNSKHEYAIMSRYRLLLLYSYRIVVVSASLSYLIIFATSFLDTNATHTMEAFLWKWIGLSLFLAIVIVPALCGLLRSYIKPNRFFIMDTLEDNNPNSNCSSKTRLYIVKVTLDRELILSNRRSIKDPRGYKIFKPISYVMDKKIHMESKERKSRYKPPTVEELS